MPMVKPATPLSKKILPKDSFVTDEGQPARYGPF